MTTISKTFVENYSASYRSTWYLSMDTMASQEITSSTFTLNVPNIQLRYVGSNKGYAKVSINMYLKYNNYSGDVITTTNEYLSSLYEYSDHIGRPSVWASNTTKTLTGEWWAVDSYVINTSSLFNSTNKNTTTRIIDGQVYAPGGLSFITCGDAEGQTYFNGYDNEEEPGVLFPGLYTLILNAPPIVQHGTPTLVNPYIGVATYTVPLNSISAQYGGDITSVELYVGTWDSSTFSGESTIKTYSTPTVTNDTISVTIEHAGTFIPKLVVTDSRGQKISINLTSITVMPHVLPTLSFDIFRSNAAGIKDDEGNCGLIIGTFTFSEGVVTLSEPEVTIDETISANTTWYTGLLTTRAVDPATEIDGINITWEDIHSGTTLYGVINNNFSTARSYRIDIDSIDSLDARSGIITQFLSTAFYTIDFQAGGKEIAFGAPAKVDDLYSNINTSTPPTWIAGIYYKKVVDVSTASISYELLTSSAAPNDWTTNWTNYYELVHEEGLFKCAMDAEFNDMSSEEIEDFMDSMGVPPAVDYIIEQSTNDIWTYRKWSSGIVECWGRWTETLTNYGTWNNMYSYASSIKTLPFAINNAIPTYSAKVANGYVFGCSLLRAYQNPLTEVGFYCSASASGSQEILWVCDIKGRWK